jgi:aryl-alcohol dehydrogenase-like predicted oxidoreductase
VVSNEDPEAETSKDAQGFCTFCSTRAGSGGPALALSLDRRQAAPMQLRSLGPLRASPIALGAGHIGGDADEREVVRLLDRAFELGINLIDTARSYGASEERIGRWEKRNRVLLSTKVGYGVEGAEDWTGPCITRGIERALRTLRTDRIDLVHLHSCPVEILERSEVLRALLDAVAAGKVRVAAYSGDGAALDRALRLEAFGVVQATLNLCDRANAPLLLRAKERGTGVIAKRPLANAPWRFASRPDAPDLAAYFDRFCAMRIDAPDPAELCLRFAAHHPAVDTVLIGTRNALRLEPAITALARGPLAIDPPGWDPSWPAIT